jgi:nucleoside-diphosphate-sugar epimerase
MSSRVFVTGATGEVGRRVVPELVRLGYGVTAVGRSEAKRTMLARLGATAVASPSNAHGRISVELAAKALAGHDIVINLATHMPPSTFRMMLPWEWRENDHIRRDDSAAFVSAAIESGVSRFIQESFAPVYDDNGDRWIDETCPVLPVAYNRSVLDAERSVERFSTSGGVGVVVRFAGFYGPDQLLRDMVKIVRKGWSPVPGPPESYWSSCAHDDAASAVVATLKPSVVAGIYNVCDDEPLHRREWVATLARAADAPMPKQMPGWLSRFGGTTLKLLSRSQRMSNAKLKRASGWEPRWPSARDGLPKAVAMLNDRADIHHPAFEEMR